MFLLLEHQPGGVGSFWFWANEDGARGAFWGSRCKNKRWFKMDAGWQERISIWLHTRCGFTTPLIKDFIAKIEVYLKSFTEYAEKPHLMN